MQTEEEKLQQLEVRYKQLKGVISAELREVYKQMAHVVKEMHEIRSQINTVKVMIKQRDTGKPHSFNR